MRNQEFHEIADRAKFRFENRLAYIQNHDLVYWMGDLNYRLDELGPDEVKERIERNETDSLLTYDQLKRGQKANKTFTEYNEAEITFRPTYKYDVWILKLRSIYGLINHHVFFLRIAWHRPVGHECKKSSACLVRSRSVDWTNSYRLFSLSKSSKTAAQRPQTGFRSVRHADQAHRHRGVQESLRASHQEAGHQKQRHSTGSNRG